MSKSYHRILRALREHPWALLPSAFEILVEIVERRIEGREPDAEEKRAAIEAARRQAPPVASPGAIAVLPVYGLLSHRAYLMQEVSATGTSAEMLLQAFSAMVADPRVTGIVLDIDSPGGSVFGTEELCDAIFAARGTKPIVAVANALAGSGAYWIASQADELVVTPSGQVGSIGVYTYHDDVSAFFEREGVKRTLVSAGRNKVEGHPYAPLSEEARGQLQKEVDRYYDRFVRSVARGRRVALKVAGGEQFGEGRMFGAEEAVERGMADRVETLQQVLDRLAKRAATASARAESAATEISADELNRRRAEVLLKAAERRG